MCNTQTYYSGTKCLSLTHTCHTTHKGGPIVPMGAAPSAPPPLVVSFSLCVWCECWRSFVWHEYRIYRIYKIYRIYRVCRVFRLYRVYRVYTVYRAYRIYRIVRIAHNILRSKHTSKKHRFIIRLFSPRSLRKMISRI